MRKSNKSYNRSGSQKPRNSFSNNSYKKANQSRKNFSHSKRKQSFFDPSILVKKAKKSVEKKEYTAKNKFNDFKVCDELKSNIAQKGFKEPSPIQDQIIPHILENRDVIGLASTGTGKTAAFLIPLINKVFKNRKEKVLIMAPTRELALQIRNEFFDFSKDMGIQSTLCIGGANIKHQINSLTKKPDFIIGTPGRLIDLEKRNKIDFAKFTAIVLDEVDQMLDMGFIHDMKYVISKLPAKKHSLFFSATLNKKMDAIVPQFLKNPVKIEIESQKASANVDQDVIKINGQSKLDLLHDLLIKNEFEKVLIFGRTKHGLNRLARNLDERGFKVSTIHGNKSQSQRQRALKDFKNDKVKIMLATDIASRGLDIDNVSHVINYDLPQSYEDYIHRIGRTGRANKTGVALSFV
jgi:superfamily II DNA/RNA helicase